MGEGNSPLKKFRAGGVTATIWENKTQKDGKDITYNTVNIERSYKDKDDKWQTTNSMRVTDLPKVELVTRKAFEFLALTGDKE